MSGEYKRLFLGYLGIKHPLFSLIRDIMNFGHNRWIGKLAKEWQKKNGLKSC
jgi:hypothetical protein